MDKVDYRHDAAKAVLLNKYGKCKPVMVINKYPSYFEYDYGVNPLELHLQMINEGYLDKPPLEDILATYKVEDLKIILVSFGESTTGRKKELVARIIERVPAEDLNNIIDNFDKYSLTDRGKEYLDKNPEYILLRKHQNWNIPFDEYIRAKQSLSFKGSFYDVTWRYFNNVIASSNISALPSNYLFMGEHCEELDRNKDALLYYIFSAYYEISGFEIIPLLDSYYTEQSILMRLENYYVDPFPTPRLRAKIHALKNHFEPSMIHKVYSGAFTMYSLRLCDEEHFSKYIQEILDGESYDEDRWNCYFRSEFIKYANKYQRPMQVQPIRNPSVKIAVADTADPDPEPMSSDQSSKKTILLVISAIIIIGLLLLTVLYWKTVLLVIIALLILLGLGRNKK